jgi:UDPglucose 6-dehydrogenase
MNVSIIGTGHVGLVTGACLAELGNSILCVDIDGKKIDDLKAGVMPFFEPALDAMVLHHSSHGNLRFGTTVAEAVNSADVIFICASTPPNADGSADISSIESVAREIADNAHGYCLVVEKSTVPVKTGERIKSTLEEYGHDDAEFDVASIPEFLREGTAVKDTLEPERIVIGATSQRAIEILTSLYEPITAPLVITDINTAEIIKHASNSFLAMKISYINAVATICERTGADVTTVAMAMGLDSRIGKQFLEAGVGYGGSCFPKDVAAFVHVAGSVGYDFEILRAVEKVNREQRQSVVPKLKARLGTLKGTRIAVLGLAFKPDTDDLRESPAVDIVWQLVEMGASVKAYDPKAMNAATTIFGERILFATDAYDAANGADALILLTQWSEFKSLDWTKMRQLLKGPLVIDGRNTWNPASINNAGLQYIGIGR